MKDVYNPTDGFPAPPVNHEGFPVPCEKVQSEFCIGPDRCVRRCLNNLILLDTASLSKGKMIPLLLLLEMFMDMNPEPLVTFEGLIKINLSVLVKKRLRSRRKQLNLNPLVQT